MTMATVGYGDVVPHTDGGKALAAIVMCISVLYLGLPSTIFGANLAELNARMRIEEGSLENLYFRKNSNAKKDSNVESMLQDLESELQNIKDNLASVTETHKKLIMLMKQKSKFRQ